MFWPFGYGRDRKKQRAGRVMSRTGIEEADVLYAGAWDNKSRAGTVLELDSRGHEVTDIAPENIEEVDGDLFVDGVHASGLEDTVVLYRQASFKAGMPEGQAGEKLLQMHRLEEEYGVEFVNSVRGSSLCSDKEVTKRQLESLEDTGREELVEFAKEEYDEGEELDQEWLELLEDHWDEEEEELDVDGFMDVEIPETYLEYEEAEQELDEDNMLVKKPFEGSLGDGIEFVEFGEIEDFEDGFMYEEFVDHYDGDGQYEEVVDSRIWVAGDGTVTVDREIDSDNPEPTNISNGGEYSDDPMESGIEEELVAYLTRQELDMEVFAIDLVRKVDEDGKKTLVPYEVNSTPGTKLNDYDVIDEDLYEMTAETVEDALEEAREAESPEITADAGNESYTPTAV